MDPCGIEPWGSPDMAKGESEELRSARLMITLLESAIDGHFKRVNVEAILNGTYERTPRRKALREVTVSEPDNESFGIVVRHHTTDTFELVVRGHSLEHDGPTECRLKVNKLDLLEAIINSKVLG